MLRLYLVFKPAFLGGLFVMTFIYWVTSTSLFQTFSSYVDNSLYITVALYNKLYLFLRRYSSKRIAPTLNS